MFCAIIPTMTSEEEPVTKRTDIQRAVGRCKTIIRLWRIHPLSCGFKADFLRVCE